MLALGFAAATARADIFAFTDANGVVHFSNVPNDQRYVLVLHAPSEEALAAPSGRNAAYWLRRSARYDATITHAAFAATVSPALVRAVIVVESGFNPRAVSRRGAKGLMQLRPATARQYGVSDIFDPGQNIAAGASYLKDLLARFDSDLELALAAYNAGEDAVERYGRQIPPYPETRDYVPRVLELYHRLLTQTKGG
jgi:soluble lytic murein transglycosylase-like protein